MYKINIHHHSCFFRTIILFAFSSYSDREKTHAHIFNNRRQSIDWIRSFRAMDERAIWLKNKNCTRFEFASFFFSLIRNDDDWADKRRSVTINDVILICMHTCVIRCNVWHDRDKNIHLFIHSFIPSDLTIDIDSNSVSTVRMSLPTLLSMMTVFFFLSFSLSLLRSMINNNKSILSGTDYYDCLDVWDGYQGQRKINLHVRLFSFPEEISCINTWPSFNWGVSRLLLVGIDKHILPFPSIHLSVVGVNCHRQIPSMKVSIVRK